MHNLFKRIAVSISALLIGTITCSAMPAGDIFVEENQTTSTVEVFASEPPLEEFIELDIENFPVEEIPETILTREEIELLALVTMAEAEAEPEEGQRLVIDSILNRVDDEHFPDTVYDVVWQKNQYECMWNGRTDRCHIREDLVNLVEEELVSRTNDEVVFFRTKRYSDYGTPLFQVGHHYFSKY